MAKAVVQTTETFNSFAEKMIAKGYGFANKKEINSLLQQLEAVSPYEGKESTGMEEGFTFFVNGLRVYIWSSFEKKLGTTRIGWDSGKVIITESNRVIYYGPEIRRTKLFFERLLMWADVLKERVLNRPTCSHCKRLMRIRYTENHQYYWYCEGFYLDREHPWVSHKWDVNLSESVMKFLKQKRERTRKYNLMRVKNNKPKHGTAREKKRSWKKRNNP